MSKVRVKPSEIQGYGAFAVVNIRKGEPVLRIDDSRVVTGDDPLRPEIGEHEYHCDYLVDGKIVLMQPPECHINHSCESNTFVKSIHRVRYVFALCDISAGEEINCINGFGDTVWECSCGSPRCLKTIHSDFFHLPLERQIEYLPLLDDWYTEAYKDKIELLLRQLGV